MTGIKEVVDKLEEIIMTEKDIRECDEKLEDIGGKISEYVKQRLGKYLGERLSISSSIRIRKLKVYGEHRAVDSVSISVDKMNGIMISFKMSPDKHYDVNLDCLHLGTVIFLIDNLGTILDILDEVLEKRKSLLQDLRNKLNEASHKMSEILVAIDAEEKN